MTTLCLGDFVFTALGTGFATLERQTDWRVAEHNRLGARPLLQFVGPAGESISIEGVCYPQLTAGAPGIEELRNMGEAGKSEPLVDQWGWVYGLWAIKSIKEKQSYFFRGQAQKIEFTLSLVRDDDGAISTGSGSRNLYS